VSAHNADTGEQLWATDLETEPAAFGGGLVATPAVDGALLFVIVNQLGSPYLAALDRTTGAMAPGWPITLDDQPNAMSNSSPVVFDGLVFAGFSGDAGPGEHERGGYVLIDIATRQVVAKHFVIPDADFAAGYAGAGIWSTPAVDLAAGYAYVGTSNPHSPQLEHARANSILKIDVDRDRPATFGTVVDHYKGLPDTYLPGLADQPVCDTYPGAYYLDRFSASCVQVDLDFGASPTLFESGGHQRLGDLQKSGVFHTVDPATMDPLWTRVVGVPCLACNAASPAAAGGDVYTAAGPPGQLFRLGGADGTPRWAGPVNGVTTYNPVTVANGIVYTVDGAGFLNGFEAGTGLPVLKRNLALDTGTFMGSASTSSGIAIARNTIYVAAVDHVIALKLGGAGGPGLPPPPEVPGGPSGGTPIVSGPGAFLTSYATPVATVRQGGSVTYYNLDAAQHDVLSVDGLFGTPLIGAAQQAPVAGVEALAPGDYGFYCSLHANMQGTLTVVAG
jgi:outer membrane protein assembly factor BamB